MQHVLALEQQDDRENHRRCATHCGADEHRFRRCLEGIARGVVGLEVVLALFEVGIKPEILLNVFFDAGNRFGLGQLEYGLGIVRDRAVRVQQRC